MSIVKMPSTSDYWDKHLQYQNISNVIPIRRFEKIKRFLHCNDSKSIRIDCTDKLYKIRPVLDTLLEYFQLSAPTEYLCIDEQMVPFKRRSKLKQYNTQKPKEWEYKLYVSTSPEGQIFNIRIHAYTIERSESQPDLQVSGNIAMHLMLKIPHNNWSKLFMVNWYTGVPLVSILMQQFIAVVGTVRSIRLKGCVLSNNKVMRQKDNCSSEVKTCEINGIELRAISWFDNCAITVLTTYEAIQPSTKVKRWNPKNGQEIQIHCPSTLVTYNQVMGVAGWTFKLLSHSC